MRQTSSESVSGLDVPPRLNVPSPVRRVRSSKATRQTPAAPSNSSDTETTDGENVLGPQSPRGKRWGHRLDAGGHRPGESPTRQGLDRELQTFISLRDKTDKDTEVRVPRPQPSVPTGALKVRGDGRWASR